jgi:hypothetical protein
MLTRPAAGPPSSPSRPARSRTCAADSGGRVGSADEAGGGLQEERRLADPGLAAEEDERAGDEAATEHPVQFADPDRQARDVHLADVAKGLRAGSRVHRSAGGDAGRP